MREHDRAATGRADAGAEKRSVLAGLLHLMVNFELHRRKSFWVDESLAYTLDQTDLDVFGRELRAPFPSFALVFTDRHVLSLAERTIAGDPACPVAGHLLRVATVFVTEHPTDDGRTLELSFALDTLGADLPHVVSHTLRLEDDTKVESYLDHVAARVAVEPEVPDSNPLRALADTGGSQIVYVGRRRDAEEVAEELDAEELGAVAYHAGLTAERRHHAQEAWLSGRRPIVVATVAFGMGIDKPEATGTW